MLPAAPITNKACTARRALTINLLYHFEQTRISTSSLRSATCESSRDPVARDYLFLTVAIVLFE
jgi:hypothetical protein